MPLVLGALHPSGGRTDSPGLITPVLGRLQTVLLTASTPGFGYNPHSL
jgi:hypothetical protein